MSGHEEARRQGTSNRGQQQPAVEVREIKFRPSFIQASYRRATERRARLSNLVG